MPYTPSWTRRAARRLLATAARAAGWAAALSACGAAVAGAPTADGAPDTVQLVQSAPLETELADPALPYAHEVWPQMFGAARERIDLSFFYVSDAPEAERPSRLGPCIDALRAAGGRGVRIRLLVDAKFADKYPADLALLEAIPGLTRRAYDLGPLTGGVQHAKYFVVDGADAYLGSQNFDWRSLTHIHELGVRLRHPELVASLGAVFELDWALAGGEPRPPPVASPAAPRWHSAKLLPAERAAEVALVASPESLLPASVPWDLPPILAAIDAAQSRVRVQVMSYALLGYDKTYWDTLDRALRRAAARGVKVELLVANWSLKQPKLEAVASLAPLRNLDVRFVTVPPWSAGPVPFARVIHAKYVTVDGAWSWLGTSNWSGDYFDKSRNVGVLVKGAPFAASLDRVFDRVWTSPLAAPLDPSAEYPPPKID